MGSSKYPLKVFLDTNVFYRHHFEFNSGHLLTLSNYIKKGFIEAYITDVVYNEVLKHFKEECVDCNRTITKKVNERKSIYGNTISVPSDEIIIKKCTNIFNYYISDNKIEIIKCDGIEIKPILEKYNKCELPFENNKEKKYEFPDAIIVEEILKKFGNNKDYIVVSSDEGFLKTFNNLSIETYTDLKSLLDNINKDNDKYDEIKTKVNSKFSLIKEKITEYVQNNDYNCIKLDGLDIDRKGTSYGYDYNDVSLNDITIIGVSVFSVDEITEEYELISLEVLAKMELSCTYFYEEASIYDNERKRYITEVNNINEENHTCTFPCTIELRKDSVEIVDVTIELNGLTRTERKVDVDGYETIYNV